MNKSQQLTPKGRIRALLIAPPSGARNRRRQTNKFQVAGFHGVSRQGNLSSGRPLLSSINLTLQSNECKSLARVNGRVPRSKPERLEPRGLPGSRGPPASLSDKVREISSACLCGFIRYITCHLSSPIRDEHSR